MLFSQFTKRVSSPVCDEKKYLVETYVIEKQTFRYSMCRAKNPKFDVQSIPTQKKLDFTRGIGRMKPIEGTYQGISLFFRVIVDGHFFSIDEKRSELAFVMVTKNL